MGGTSTAGTRTLNISGSNANIQMTTLRTRGDGTGTNTVKFTPDSGGVSTVNLIDGGGGWGDLQLNDSADVLEVDFSSYAARKTPLVLFDYADSLTGTFNNVTWTGLQSYEDAVIEYDSTNKQIKVTPFGEIIWTGATDGTWSNTGNWDLPVTPDDDVKHKVVFDTSTTGAQTIAIAANRSIAGLIIRVTRIIQ
jgi:hypothetical protein